MFYSIQFLRAASALAVVVYHANHLLGPYFNSKNSLGWIMIHGDLGVDVFFAISGFIISFMVVERQQPRHDFLVNRTARIVPPYWLFTIFAFLLMTLVPSVFRNLQASPLDLLLSLSLLSWVKSSYPIVNVGWTLTYEVYFYAAILLLYKPFSKLNWKYIALTMGLLSLTPVVALGTEVFQLLFFLEFIVGIVLFQMFRARLNPWIGVSLIATAAGIAFLRSDYRVAAGTLLGFSCLGLVLLLETKKPNLFQNRLFLSLGDASYAIYLLQFFTIPLLAKIMSRFSIPGIGLMFLIASVVVTSAASVIFYRFIELRLISWTKALLNRSSNRVNEPARDRRAS